MSEASRAFVRAYIARYIAELEERIEADKHRYVAHTLETNPTMRNKPAGSLWVAKWPPIKCGSCGSTNTHVTAAQRMYGGNDVEAPLSVGAHCNSCGTNFAVNGAWWQLQTNSVEVRA